jgi:hypothetical protein
MKKKTRAQKVKENQPHGKSNYARKKERRKKMAKKLQIEVLPLPMMEAMEEE